MRCLELGAQRLVLPHHGLDRRLLLEPGEPTEACARRELAEETGYHAARWRSLGFLYASPGVLDEKLHLFVAEDLTPGPASPEVCEQLEPVTVRVDQAIRMCLAGEIKDAKTITSLLLWERMGPG